MPLSPVPGMLLNVGPEIPRCASERGLAPVRQHGALQIPTTNRIKALSAVYSSQHRIRATDPVELELLWGAVRSIKNTDMLGEPKIAERASQTKSPAVRVAAQDTRLGRRRGGPNIDETLSPPQSVLSDELQSQSATSASLTLQTGRSGGVRRATTPRDLAFREEVLEARGINVISTSRSVYIRTQVCRVGLVTLSRLFPTPYPV
jgi:hypothetical protein